MQLPRLPLGLGSSAEAAGAALVALASSMGAQRRGAHAAWPEFGGKFVSCGDRSRMNWIGILPVRRYGNFQHLQCSRRL